ncbi:MAG TPA: hypothetical protein VLC09_20320 [Polyangiaceae bacterium]|nr:hypothetical protein [Polyangiaceae bacterium]
MASKLSEFLASKKIDSRRVVAASADIERLRPEDRAHRLAKRLSKREGGKPVAADAPKPRSGRPVTQVLLDKIEAGKVVPSAAKTRVLRAVNAVLESKKTELAQFKDLF